VEFGFARTALFNSILCGVLEARDNFHERRFHFSLTREVSGVFLSEAGVFRAAFTTTLFVFDIAGRF